MIASIADLVAFLKRFHRDRLADPSLDLSLIPTDLPDGLATVYRELGRFGDLDYPTPFYTQDSLRPLGRLRRVDGMIEFAGENSGNWSARCPPGQPDPPVYANAWDGWNEAKRGFVVVCQSLNHFLTTLLLQEAVMGCRHLELVRTDERPEQILAVPIRPVWLNGCYVNGEPERHYYATADENALVMESFGVWVGSKVTSMSELLIPGVRRRTMS